MMSQATDVISSIVQHLSSNLIKFFSNVMIAAQAAGAGGNNVPQPGQSGEGDRVGAQGDAERGDLRQAAGNERRLGIVAIVKTVRNARAKGNDVLQGAAQFHADDIRIGKYAETLAGQQFLSSLGGIHVRGSYHCCRGHVAHHFSRQVRAGKRADITCQFFIYLLRDDLGHALVAAFLQSFGGAYHQR